MKILHIAPHMGAGTGRALTSLCTEAHINNIDTHEIILLEEPQNKQSYEQCRMAGIDVKVVPYGESLENYIRGADIVQVEWWHHPLIEQFLANFPELPVRLVIWCHVSGNNYPLLSPAFISKPNKFVFTSACSLDNVSWNFEEKKDITCNTAVISSNGDLQDFINRKVKSHKGFNIGYVGTQNFCRLHPDFIKLCKEIKIPEAKFIMAGDNTNLEKISNQAKQAGILDSFRFLGYVNNIVEVLQELDVFAYPMHADHYGTTENAIIEAMAIGLPVVLFNQCCEKYIVEHNKTGLLVNSAREYGEAIRYLYNHPQKARELGENAKEHVKDRYNAKVRAEKFHQVYEQIIEQPKQIICFSDILGTEPYEWFMSALNTEKEWFLKSIDLKRNIEVRESEKLKEIEHKIANARLILREPTKFSILHYYSYFKDDIWLKYWAEILERIPYGEF